MDFNSKNAIAVGKDLEDYLNKDYVGTKMEEMNVDLIIGNWLEKLDWRQHSCYFGCLIEQKGDKASHFYIHNKDEERLIQILEGSARHVEHFGRDVAPGIVGVVIEYLAGHSGNNRIVAASEQFFKSIKKSITRKKKKRLQGDG